MKVYNDNQLYQSPAGDQLRNSGRQNWIFGRIGDQEGAISDPAQPLRIWPNFAFMDWNLVKICQRKVKK